MDAPQSRVGVEIAHIHGGVYFYDVPIVGPDRNGQKDKAEGPADASCGHHQAQLHLHRGSALGLWRRFGVNVRTRTKRSTGRM